ncbi:hypothetical protein [Paenibacillus chibensis]|uniref:hypothetical protein n=1 Tax=Paenibacillus chibensis TaxID=59846 RepID=UPI000FD87985|nr:hypothetical protein [Paenibacillus chibensis]MEC0372868.1 hypothetical protein [Paenibacillus chibensis]
MNMHPYQNLTILLILSLNLTGISGIQIMTGIQRHEPSVLALISFLVALGSLAGFLFIVYDMVTRRQDRYEGKIINKEGRSVNILTTENRLKRLRVNLPEVLERLQAEQNVEFKLTHFTRIPVSIHVLAEAPVPERVAAERPDVDAPRL